MSAQAVAALTLAFVSLLTSVAPDLQWALGAFGWSALGFVAGIGVGWLLWGPSKEGKP